MQMKDIAIEFHTRFYLINVIEYFNLVTVITRPEIGEFSFCYSFSAYLSFFSHLQLRPKLLWQSKFVT